MGLLPVIDRDADAAGQDHLLPGDLHRRAQRAANPLGHGGDLVGVGFRDDQGGELIAADPGKGVLRLELARQPAGDGQQHGVADGQPQRPVDVPEAVDVDIEDGGPLALALMGAGRGATEAVEEQLPVRQSRQTVVDRVVQQPLMGPLGAGHVPHQPDATQRGRLLDLDALGAQLVPEIAAVAAPHAQLGVEHAALALLQRPQQQAQALAVVGMHEAEPFLRRQVQGPGRQTEGILQIGTHRDLVAAHVPIPHIGAGARERLGVELQAVGERAIDGFARAERVLGDGETQQYDHQHQAGDHARDHQLARKPPRDHHCRAENPDQEQDPCGDQGERALLAAQGEKHDQRRCGEPGEGERGARQARGHAGIEDGKPHQRQLGGDPQAEAEPDDQMPIVDAQEGVEKQHQAGGEHGLGAGAVGGGILRSHVEQLVPESEIDAEQR